MANLTDPDVMRAHLRDVRVERNDYLGIEGGYFLKDLFIAGNGPPGEEFFVGIKDVERIRAVLDPLWPDGFPAAVPALDANAMCTLCDWKVRVKFQEELDGVFRRAMEEEGVVYVKGRNGKSAVTDSEAGGGVVDAVRRRMMNVLGSIRAGLSCVGA